MRAVSVFNDIDQPHKLCRLTNKICIFYFF